MTEPLFKHLFDEIERRPMTVSELAAGVKALVERGFGNVWVEGEIVNFVHASSGHWYFTLNDGTAQIKCTVWKSSNFRIRFKPKNGVTVRVRGRVTFWEPKGDIKLNVETLEPSGEGALAAAFEQIKARLDGEGLFAKELKRPIPFFPRRVAIVTSRNGAAKHDIVSVLTRRARTVSILLVPALVQGEGAADSIRAAITRVNKYNRGLEPVQRIDVMIVGRGGGSAEDLWAFNDEALARAIRASEIPVISAVGHEIDWTISDMVADVRAATPSAAAEIVAGREEDIFADLNTAENALRSTMSYKMLHAGTRTREASDGLRSAFGQSVQRVRSWFADVSSRLTPATLTARTVAVGNKLAMLDQRRVSSINRLITSKTEALNIKMATLDALSPLGVLTRGYSITQTADGKVLRDASSTRTGDKLKIRLEHGKLDAEVLSSES